MKIGFIGLGNMGRGMCLNLMKAGHDLQVFDVNADALKDLLAAGAKRADNIASLGAQAEVIISMLPNGDIVRDVYLGDAGVVRGARAHTLFIDCSTIAVDDARAIAKTLAEKKFDMLDAPVSGGTAASDAGTLTFMVGGTAPAFLQAKPLLAAMGKNIFHAGASGNGQVAKIANNMLLGISMIGTCEAFNLAEKLGLDAQTFFDIASTASGQCWSMTSYCPAPGPVEAAPSNRDYAAGFAVAMMLKDLNLAQMAANLVEAQTPLGEHAQEIYKQLDADGFGGLDFSSVMKRLQGAL